jgi:hypothetical protein
VGLDDGLDSSVGNVIIDGYMRAGLFGFPTPIDLVPPVRMLVEYLVTEFDNLLHAISSVSAVGPFRRKIIVSPFLIVVVLEATRVQETSLGCIERR